MLLKKKLFNGFCLCAYSRDTETASGILIGSKKADEKMFRPVVKLMCDNDGKMYLVINKDKLEEMNGEIVVKTLDEYFEPIGFKEGE